MFALLYGLTRRVLFAAGGDAHQGAVRRPASPLAAALGADGSADEERVTREALARLAAVAIRYVGSREEALDCAQEAMIRAVRSFDSFEGRSSVTSWMHRIAVNCALDHMRRRAARNEVSIDDLMPTFDDQGFLEGYHPVTDDTAEEILQRSDARTAVAAAIQSLPATHRSVLLLRDIEEMSIREVAERLEIAENAAKVRIHRARSALRKLLEPMIAAGQI